MLWLLTACTSDPEPVPADEAARTVVVVIGCTVRADRLPAYGNPSAKTPYLDQLVAGGTTFEHTLSNAPWTRPGIAALTTGLYPSALGIDDEGVEMNNNRGLHPDVLTLAERFQDAGWATVGGTANPNANEVFGMTQGFDDYFEGSGLWREKESDKVEGHVIVREVMSRAKKQAGDLYLQMVVVDTHKPLNLPAWFPAQFKLTHGVRPTPSDRYDATLPRLDDVLQQLDDELKRMGRNDRTLVLIGDHGEGLENPEWALRSHGRRLYDANLHVPWVMNGPGIQEGHRVSGLSESVDLVPTLVELYDLEPGTLHGDSRVPQLQGSSETGEAMVFSETWFAQEHHARITTPEWTYIRNYATTDRGGPDRGEHEIYAATDRRQAVPLKAQDAKVAMDRLEVQLEELRAEVGADPLIWEGEELTDELHKQLEGLGYIED